MSNKTAKKYRRIAKKVMIGEHHEVIKRYLDGYCDMKLKNRIRFAWMIVKGKNPIRIMEEI